MADKLRSSPTISTPTQLANERNVTIVSDPAYDYGTAVSAGKADFPIGTDNLPVHRPAVDRQSCTDITSGIIYEWYNNEWH